MSTGLQNLLTEIAKWTALAVMFALFIFNFETLKSATAGLLGVDADATSLADGQRGLRDTASGQRAQPAPSSRHSNDGHRNRQGPRGDTSRLRDAPAGWSAPSRFNYHTTPVSPGPQVRLKSGRGGHFYAPVDLNGRRIEAVVDTGATTVALSYEDARTAGIFVHNSDFTMRMRTANGIARAAPVRIDRIDLDGITVRNVRATVAEPGRLHITLLGMSFLGKLRRFEMQRGELILEN